MPLYLNVCGHLPIIQILSLRYRVLSTSICQIKCINLAKPVSVFVLCVPSLPKKKSGILKFLITVVVLANFPLCLSQFWALKIKK